MSSTDNPSELPPDIKALLDAQIEARADLLRARLKIPSYAHVTSTNFTIPEERFEAASKKISAQLQVVLQKEIAEGRINVSSIGTEIQDYADQKVKAVKAANPDLEHAYDTAALDKIYVEEYVKNAKPKNTQIKSTTRTEQELFADMLDKNDTVGLADIHNSAESLDFLTRNMGVFKAHGGKRIKTENGQLIEFTDFSIDELQKLAKERKLERVEGDKIRTITLDTPEEIAKRYGLDHSDDTPLATVRMVIAAKENNIELVPMDGSAFIRNFELKQITDPDQSLSTKAEAYRITRDNFIWTDADGPIDGKTIDFGGMNHFISHLRNGRIMNGLVERDHAPVIAFERADKNGPAFRRGSNPNGPDFWLPGGLNYPDTVSTVLGAKINPVKAMLQDVDGVPKPLISEQTAGYAPGATPLAGSGRTSTIAK
jgi:hypothetical protein